MRKIKALALALSMLALTGCEGGYGEFDLLSEYLKSHPEMMIEDTVTVLGCEACVPVERAGEQEIRSLYLQLFDEGRENGYVPVIVYVDEVLEETINYNFGEKGREAYIAETLSAERTDGKELFDKYYSEIEEYFGEELKVNGGWIDSLAALYGTAEGSLVPSGYLYEGELCLVKVPAENPYEIFAWLPFCGWNSCPDVGEMISMCEYWYNEYGAVPAAITYDTLTFYLSEPVTDKETAIKAAKEQCAFASDVLGMGGIDSYVAMTLNSNVWTFWWD